MKFFPLLSILIWFPIIGGGALLACSACGQSEALKKKFNHWIRYIALLMAIFCLLLCIPLVQGFDNQLWQMQWTETHDWIPNFGIYYRLGVDGFSIPLIVLTCFMTPIVVMASYMSVKERVAEYLAAFLIMQGLVCGALSAVDSILFYTFWEGMLIPMFLIIGMWGGQNRIYATIKFFLYTFLGSVLFLVALIFLHSQALASGIALDQAFNILTFHQLPLSFEVQKWVFLAFLLAFAVKVPMWPVHTWLPDAHVEAPTGGSVILAAILLKMGGYGFLRFMLPITPDASAAFSMPMIILSLIAIVYIGLVAIVQQDMKKLIAYSSISHMGFVTLGFFLVFGIVANTAELTSAEGGIEGAMIQMISHGFVSGALFLCVGVLYDRLHSRMIKDYGGVVNPMPIFASFFMLFAMANVGLPGTSGFVGEFLVILSAYKANIGYAFVAGSILILGASYTLWMYKRVIFGTISGPAVATLKDLNFNEKFIFMLLAVMVLWLGLYPAPLLELMHSSVSHLVAHITQSKL